MPVSKPLVSNRSIARALRDYAAKNDGDSLSKFYGTLSRQAQSEWFRMMGMGGDTTYLNALNNTSQTEWTMMAKAGEEGKFYLAMLNEEAQGYNKRPFQPIDNYIYLYHTNTLIILPQYPKITDSTQVQYSQSTALGRSAPIYSYNNSGPRSMQIDIQMHRESMNQMNYTNSNSALKSYMRPEDDYVDVAIRLLQAAALPNYAASQKMVDPPLVACRFGKDIYIKGVINGAVGISYDLPILKNDKFAQISVSFGVSEVDAYDASMVEQIGSYRDPGDLTINTTLDNTIFTTPAGEYTKKDKITQRLLMTK